MPNPLKNLYPWGPFVPPGSGVAIGTTLYLLLLPFDSLTETQKASLSYVLGQGITWTAQAHGLARLIYSGEGVRTLFQAIRYEQMLLSENEPLGPPRPSRVPPPHQPPQPP